ncbi:hypothetical protein THASP1DRAFT_33407, partial [Thamnocephalis sphaerospora]
FPMPPSSQSPSSSSSAPAASPTSRRRRILAPWRGLVKTVHKVFSRRAPPSKRRHASPPLAPEIWHQILTLLDASSALQLAGTSRHLRQLVLEDRFYWRQLYAQKFALSDDIECDLLRWAIAQTVAPTGPPVPDENSASDDIASASEFFWPTLPDAKLLAFDGPWCRVFARRVALERNWSQGRCTLRRVGVAGRQRHRRVRPIAASTWGTLVQVQESEQPLLLQVVPTIVPSTGADDAAANAVATHSRTPSPASSTSSSVPAQPTLAPAHALLLDTPPYVDIDRPLVNGRYIAICGQLHAATDTGG